MKRVVYLFLFLSFFANLKGVFAEEASISYRRLDGIFYNQVIDGVLDSNMVTSFHLNDRIAYCIEPGVEINTREYDINNDWSSISLSDDVKEYIEKVGYYGYEYPGHQTNRYYIAAQELIWKAVRPDIVVSWSTGKNNTGDLIDVSAEKAEIESLVASHSLIPSFSDSLVVDYTGSEIILEDTNNVLEYYDVSSSENHEIVKDGNVLKIKLNDSKVSDEEIVMTRSYYDKAPLLVYSRGDSQKLAALRITMDKESKFTISNKERPLEEEVIEVPNTNQNIFDLIYEMFFEDLGLIYEI